MFKNDYTVTGVVTKAVEQLNDNFSEREKKRISKELVFSKMNLSSHDYVLNRHATVDKEIVEEVLKAISEINRGIPFQYLVGKVFFYDHEFQVDRRVLIPRPETEELVQCIVDFIRKEHVLNASVLDVGTGSGCIAISLQKAIGSLNVEAVDVSEEALDLAKRNGVELGTAVNFFKGDALTGDLGDGAYDIIVSNPPYIPDKEKETMSLHVVEHEPHVALFIDDSDPIIFYKRIADAGLNMLKKRGYLFFEIHENFAEDVQNYLFLKGYENVTVIKDLQGKDRIVTAQLNAHE